MSNFNYKEMGRRIYQLKVKRGLTDEKLAKKAHLSKDTISKLEQGKTKPSADTIFKVAQALECTPNYIYGVNVDLAFIERMTPEERQKLRDFFESYNK